MLLVCRRTLDFKLRVLVHVGLVVQELSMLLPKLK